MNTTAGIGTPYWFEWEVGLLKCLEMLQDDNIVSVVFQSSKFTSLDDVVVNYRDGTRNIQVKHSEIGGNLTFSSLLSKEKPMLITWAQDWKRNKNEFNIKEISVVTNREWGRNKSKTCCSFYTFLEKVFPKWKENKDYIPEDPLEKEGIFKIKKALSFLNNELYDFIRVLSFKKVQSRDEQNLQIRSKISEIIGIRDESAIDIVERNLRSQLHIWATSKRSKEEVYREDVYDVICNQQIPIAKYEVYPEKPIFPSRIRFASEFKSKLESGDKKTLFLKGLPGSGKTNFISYLAQIDNSIVDFRFYTYLPIKKDETYFSDDSGYYTSEYLWNSLLVQLKEKFSTLKCIAEVNFPLCYGFMSVQEKRQAVLHFLDVYAQKIKRSVNVFIDGIDHAARSAERMNKTFLESLPADSEIEGNVKFIFVGQPLNNKYPSWLINEQKVIAIDLPVVETEDVILLLNDAKLKMGQVNQIILAESIIQLVGNNALNVFFALYELKKTNLSFGAFDDFIDQMKEKGLDKQIENYYEWICAGFREDFTIQKTITLFSFLTKKIKLQEIALLISKDTDETAFILEKLYPLIQKDDNGYFCYHNDVRLYFLSKISVGSFRDVVIKSFYEIIQNDDSLEEIGYYFMFDSLIVIDNKNFLYSFYTPEYIIKSVQYVVPIDIIEKQLKTCFNDFYKNKRIDKIIEICSLIKTYHQLVNCIRWNDKDSLFYNSKEKCFSEKNMLKISDNIQQIINDIYLLLMNNENDRGQKLFEEYLSNLTLKHYEGFIKLQKDWKEVIKKAGYICREYNKDFLRNEKYEPNNLYASFVEGWLERSCNKLDFESVKDTCTFKCVRPIDYLFYIKEIVKNIDLHTIQFLQEQVIKSHNISILIEICNEKIFRGIYDEKLIKYLDSIRDEILVDDSLMYDWDRIAYFFKLYFCEIDIVKDQYYNLYLEILKKAHITEKDRGFIPAMSLWDVSNNLFEGFYMGENVFDLMQENVAKLFYFEEKHGAGSSHDCDAFNVRQFLFRVIYESLRKEHNVDLIFKLCESLAKYAFMSEKPKYYAELIKCYFIVSETKKFAFQIFDFWVGNNGVAWNREYSEVEYYCNNAVSWLTKEKLFDEASLIEKRKKLKIIGYVGRKDYSLSDLLDWFAIISDGQDKFVSGLNMLSISDYADKIGDNRMDNSINSAMFDLAIKLGPRYVDCLFNIKNTPQDFYYWRKIFKTEYIQYIENADLPDEELIALFEIFNAWSKPEIEATDRVYSNNNLIDINNSKFIIASKLKDCVRREKLLKDLSKPKIDLEKSRVVSTSKEKDKDLEILICHLANKGLDNEGEQLLIECLCHNENFESSISTIDNAINQRDRELFVKKYLLPYISTHNEYGYYTRGFNSLIDKNYNYISIDDYFNLMNLSFQNINKGNDFLYSIVDDIECLSLSLYKLLKYDEPLVIFNKKIDLHKMWITSCGEFEMDMYQAIFDDKIKTIKDFSEKYI